MLISEIRGGSFFKKQKLMETPSLQLKLQAPWEEVKERMKENDFRLTDDDLAYEPGQEEELLQRLEKIMNKPRHEIIAYIESISFNSGIAG
jgi:hypothetical protein